MPYITNCTLYTILVKWKQKVLNMARNLTGMKKNMHEWHAWNRNQMVAGIDEAGRGCLAGPVVAAAVILRPDTRNKLIKDSKHLQKHELISAYNWLTRNCWYAYGIIDNRAIDRINIYHATLRAMERATAQLLATCPHTPETLLVDAMPLSYPSFAGNILHFPKGEEYSKSIAAASIIAKVTRDKIMHTIGNTFPSYKLQQHKGYATKEHKSSIIASGASIIHRQRFLRCLHEYRNTHVQTEHHNLKVSEL